MCHLAGHRCRYNHREVGGAQLQHQGGVQRQPGLTRVIKYFHLFTLMFIIRVQESGGGDPVYSCKFSPDGNLLALGSRDNALYIYQV